MVLIKNSSLNKLMVKLEKRISLGEGIRYSVPDLWNCFGYKGQEKSVDEKGITLVNPYKFYFSCINDFIMPKKDITRDYNKSISQMLCNVNEKKEYLGGDWIIKKSVYAMDVRISTCWNHSSNEFKDSGTFLKTIALLPLLKKMGITTLYLGSISKSFSAVENLFVIDSDLKDTIQGEDFTVEEEFRALVEACHILDIRIIIDIVPKYIKLAENIIDETLRDTLLNSTEYYQNNFGIDGVRLDIGQALPGEFINKVVESSRRIDNDFCFIIEGCIEDIADSHRKNGCNMVSNYNWDLEARIFECKTYEFMYGLSKFKSPIFAFAETMDTPRIAAREGGKTLSKFLTTLNEFLPNSVPIITSGIEVYETKSLNSNLALGWSDDNRWDIPDTLETLTKIKNEFLETFTNPENFLHINFESPYTTAVGLAYVVEGKRWMASDNVIIIVGNADLYNNREYTLFLDNVRNESGNVSKRAWLMYSQNEWSHDIYDFDHQSDLQLSFKPGEVKVLIM